MRETWRWQIARKSGTWNDFIDFLFSFSCHQTIYVILSHYWLMFVLKCPKKKQEYSMDATCEPMNNKYWTTTASNKDKNKVKDQLKRFHTTHKQDNVFRHSTIQQYRGSGREWSGGLSFIVIIIIIYWPFAIISRATHLLVGVIVLFLYSDLFTLQVWRLVNRTTLATANSVARQCKIRQSRKWSNRLFASIKIK